MTYEERIEKLKKRVNYQGSSEYTVSENNEENARERLSAARKRYTEEANANQLQKKAASESAKQQSTSKITAENYEQQKSELKQEKKDAWDDRISTWFKNIGTQLNPNSTDTEKAIAKSRYTSAKLRQQTISDDYDILKENEWNSTQEENAKIIASNSEIQKLVEQARNAKINLDSAKENTNYYQNFSDSGSVANNLAVQQQQKEYQNAYNTYNSILSKINDLGYDGESLVDTYTRQKNLEETEQLNSEVSKFADDHPVLASGTYVALNSAQAAALPTIIENGIVSQIKDEYIPLDINSGEFGATNIRDTIAETTSSNIENSVKDKTDSEFLANASSFLYQTGLSMGDFASLAALPNSASLAIMGSSAAASTAKDATERGLSADNALATATAAAAAEIFFEKFSLEGLKALKATGRGGIKNTVKDVLKQSFTEGSEEFFTDISNAITDQIINGDDSSLSQQYQAYLDSGMSSQQAQKQVATDFAEQVGQSFLGGAISGGVLGAGASTLRNAQLNSAYRAEGRAIQSTGREGVAAVINEGLAQNSSSPAYKAASELLSRNTETDTYEIPETLSGRNLGRLGKLQQMNVQANDLATFSDAVSRENNSESLVNTFEKITKGEDISKKEANALMENKTARAALSEITNIDEINSSNLKNNRDLLNGISNYYLESSRQTFSSANPLSSDQTRSFLNQRLNTPAQQYGNYTSAATANNLNREVTLNDGTDDTIKSIDRVENGIVYLNTDNGNIIEAQNVDFADNNTAELYNSASAYDTDTAKVYAFGFTDNGYNGTVADYNTGFNAVYRAQKQGYSLEDAYNLAREESNITPMQAELAYNAAKNEDMQAPKSFLPKSDNNTTSVSAERSIMSTKNAVNINTEKQSVFNKALKSKKKPGATVIAEKLSKSQQAEVELIGEYAKSIGREVIIVNDTEELGYGRTNGMYKNGKIVLALNNTGGVMSVYFGHELFHDLKQTAPAQANELQAYVLDRLKSNADYDYNARFADLEDKYADSLKGKTESQKKSVIDEEIAANACFTVLSNEDNFTALVKQNRSLAEKVRDFFADFIEKIKNALTRLAKNNAEYSTLQNDTEAKEKILAMFNKALESSQNNSASKNGHTKFSKKSSFDKQIDAWDKKTVGFSFVVGSTEGILENIDLGNGKIVGKKQIRFDATKIKSILNKHNAMSIDLIKQIPEILNNPVVVTRSNTNSERIVVLGDVYDNNGKLVIVALELNPSSKSGKSTYTDVIKIATAQGRSHIQSLLRDVLYIDNNKNRVRQWLNVNRLQLPLRSSTANSNNSISNSNENVKFSLKELVEETKDLIAVHNINESNLLKSLDLGGFPMPSIAIMKAQQADANADYGNTSIVFYRDTVDPQLNRFNKVYGGDAWTPRFPSIEYEIDYDKASNIYHIATSLNKKRAAFNNTAFLNPYNIEDSINRLGIEKYIKNLKKDYTLKQLYLLENGEQPVEMQQHEDRTEVSEAYAELYDYLLKEIPNYHIVPPPKWNDIYGAVFDKAYSEYYRNNFNFSEDEINNVLMNMNVFEKKSIMSSAQRYAENGRVTVTVTEDPNATEELIDRKIDKTKFEQWVDNLFSDIVLKQGIRNNTDPYTSSGEDRSFDELHYEVTLENIVKQMKTQENGEGALFSGLGIWGVAAKSYGTIDELKDDSYRLQNLTDEEYSKIKTGFGERLTEISHSLESRYKSDNPYIDEDNKMTNILDALRSSKTKTGVLNYLKRYFNNANESTVEDLLDLVADIGNMPTQYFEAKPQRAVRFNEVAYVVMPDNASQELKSKLNENSIRYEEYAAGNEQNRVDTLNSLDDVKFSMKEEDNTSVFEDNEELAESAEDVKNMLRFVATENNELRKAFDIRTVRQAEDSSVAKVAAYLRKQYDSTYKKSDLVSNLAGLYNYITNAGENIDNEYVWRTAKSIAANVLANTQYKDTTLYEDYKQLRERIRTQNILVPDSVKADMTDYNAFRKRNFGRMRLSNDSGIALDTLYSELSAEYPEFFAPEAVLSDQLENIENFFVSTSPVYYNGAEMMAESEGLSLDEYTNIVASDIFNQYFDVPEVKSFVSETHQREMQELKSDYESQISDMRKMYQQRYEEQLVELRKENERRLSELKDKNDVALQKLKDKNLEAIAKQKAHFKDVSKRATQRRKASKIRESIRRNLQKIARMGAKPDKKKHIPNSIIDSVKAFADAITLDDTKKDQKIKDRLNQFRDSFESIKSSDSEYAVISEAYNDYISDQIKELQNSVGDKTIKQLSVSELEQIDKLVKMTTKTISNINKLFLKERNATIEEYAQKVALELEPMRKEKITDNVIKSLAYNSLKPEYFFQYLGSDAMLELYHDLRHGEDVWALDVQEARSKALDLRKKYGWHNWDKKTKLEFNTIGGKIELSLQERLGIYANSLGEHTKNHLLGGGFTYQPPDTKGIKKYLPHKNDNSAHRLSEENVSEIISSLTDEQKSYVKDMIEFLSETMGAKGNEISRTLYDIDLFTEKMYYPAKVDSKSRHQSTKEVRTEKQIKNAGFTNSAIQDANQPIILYDFDTVWAQHIDEMSKYHAFVLPLENIDRVYNLYSVKDGQYSSIKEIIENAYGSKALNYIEDLIKDINGGVVQEAGTDALSSLTSLFKKNAVFASMSVTIQQPSAIARALSEVDAKYFAKTTGSGFNRKAYEEMKKYAPVAIIKEMGYFDTNMAQSTVDYLNKDFYEGAKEKLKAFVKDGDFRDDAMTFFASKADEITWTHIWNAVKAETKAKHPELSGNSGQLLKKAGTRFTEIITKTQVYDSVFSRSGLMRSRDSGVKNAMAFMAEPTTSLNMFTNAIIQAKRGKISKSQAGKVFGSLVASSVLNAVLQTIVTAARADDDDKEYSEIYLAQLLPNFIDNVNPINQIVFLKDVVNIFKGYDITRADMNLVSDLFDAIKKLDSQKATTEEKITGLAGAIAAFFGLPVKNVIRDVKAAFNVAKDVVDDDSYSNEDALSEFKEEMNSAFGFELFKTDLEKAIKAVKKEDEEEYQKYAEKIYASDDAYDLLYEVLKQYGYSSSMYQQAENQCVSVKQKNGSEKPNPDSAMKDRAIKDYAIERYRPKEEGGDYNKSEPYRQICMALYGSMTDVEEALKNYAITQYMKIRNEGTSEEVKEAEQLCLNVYGSERAFQAAIRKFEEDDD